MGCRFARCSILRLIAKIHCGFQVMTLSFQMWEFDYHTMDIFRVTPGEATCERLTSSEFQEKNPTVSPDGKFLIYASDSTGISNLYRRMNLETSRETEAITNALTGCFQPKLFGEIKSPRVYVVL